jgi:cytochrome c556
MKRVYQVGMVAALAAVSAGALAQGAVSPAKSAAEAKAAIEARQKIFEDIKRANAPLGEMLRGKRELDPAVVAASAKQLQELSNKIPAAFLVDTRPFKDTKTEAGDNIWASFADFKTKSENTANLAGTLATVAAGGDKAAIRKAMVDMSKSCGACHDSYKVKL